MPTEIKIIDKNMRKDPSTGKLKKSVAISKDAKVVSRPGKEDVTKKLNFLDKRRLNKNI